IAGATVPLALRRLVETGQMGTPVLQYRAYGHQDGARLVLEMQGQWRYQAYQSKRRLMIDVVPVKSALTGIAAAGLQEGKTYGGPRLS
ncbi:AMIN domain-containing protein, partial [Acinetobacter baumannii]